MAILIQLALPAKYGLSECISLNSVYLSEAKGMKIINERDENNEKINYYLNISIDV